MPSQDYKDLKNTVGLLRRHLLPLKFDPMGLYREKVFTGVVSFRVLCHAAIEEYLETKVVRVAAKSSLAAGSGRIGHASACLLSFSDTHFGPPPDTLMPPQGNQSKHWTERIDILERTKKASSSFINFVKQDNHGVREKNVLRLLLPIGFRVETLDPVLLAELDSFGQSRGQFAHTSASAHIKNKPDPKNELERVSNILDLLLNVDLEIERILESIPNPNSE